MSSLHPQAAQLLEQVARSPLPPVYALPPQVARRIYLDSRTVLGPVAPEVAEARLMLVGNSLAIRAYRPAGTPQTEVLPALVYFHGGGWTIGDLDTHDVLCRQLANGARCAVF